MSSLASTSRLMLTSASRQPIRQYVHSIRSSQFVCIRLQHTESQNAPLIDTTAKPKIDTTTIDEKLTYLDHLYKENPVRRKRVNIREDTAIRKQNEWDSIMKMIKKSFTIAQLTHLRHYLSIPNSDLDLQRQFCNSRKDALVRAIMIKRFNMNDLNSTLYAKKNKEGANVKKETVTVMQDLPLHVAYLAFDIAAQKTNDEFQKLRVKVSTVESSQEEQTKGVQINLTGTQKDVDKAIAWLQSFTAEIRIEKSTISSIISSPWFDVSDVTELDKIAQSSNSIITIGDAPDRFLTIYSINEAWLKEAKRRLSKYQHHLREIKDRSLLTYASTYSSDDFHSFPPMYALQPFLQRYLSADQNEPSYFRLARQDNDIRRPNMEERPKLLQNIDGEDETEPQIFSKLQERLERSSNRSLNDLSNLEGLTYKAEFGHLLFKSVEENGEMLPEAPFNEQVVLERASSWLSKDVKLAKQEDKIPANSPRFVAAVPPSASRIEAPIDKFRTDQDDELQRSKSIEELHEGIQDILNSFPSKEAEAVQKMSDLVKDLKKFDEYLAIRYASNDELLEIKIVPKEKTDASQERENLMNELFGKKDDGLVLEGEANDNLPRDEHENDDEEEIFANDATDSISQDLESVPSSPWERKGRETHLDQQRLFWLKLESVTQTISTQADVLVPEAATDVRLCVESARLVPQKAIEEMEVWQEFIKQISPENTFMEKETLFNSAKSISAPTQLTVEGKTYSLLDQVAVNEWRWRVDKGDGNKPDYNARAILQIEKQCSPCSSTASQKKFSLKWKRPTRRQAIAPQTTVWENAEPILKAALNEDYKERSLF